MISVNIQEITKNNNKASMIFIHGKIYMKCHKKEKMHWLKKKSQLRSKDC